VGNYQWEVVVRKGIEKPYKHIFLELANSDLTNKQFYRLVDNLSDYFPKKKMGSEIKSSYAKAIKTLKDFKPSDQEFFGKLEKFIELESSLRLQSMKKGMSETHIYT
jgi:hypothetical protein